MSVYSEKPWLKNYKVGSFKLKTSMEYPEKPLFSILDEAAVSWSGRDAIYFLEKRIKYRDLIELVDRFANALHNLGLEKGERVVVFLPTCPQYIISDFAVLKNGAVIV
ncbi:MAG: AMP-binding protein, partial [Spirochaetales bacterium]|nr:AMP-binding protein [Spirochaetales bacterium]